MYDKQLVIVNLFGVPSAGKSTGAAYIFSQLKNKGINAELITEFAKDKVWEENSAALSNQAYIFGKQYYRISRCQDKVEVIVTDSPILNSVLYNTNETLGLEFNTLVSKVFHSYDSMNYLLLRDKPYNPVGRLQTEAESDAMVEPLRKLLLEQNVRYTEKNGNFASYSEIVSEVMRKLGCYVVY